MDVALAIQHQAGFTLELFKAVLSQTTSSSNEKEGDNAVMSPISIATALAMTGAGAKGHTLAELLSVLKLPEGDAMHEFSSQISAGVLKDASEAGGPLLSFANGIWVEKSIKLKTKFQEIVKGSYGAEVRSADFAKEAEGERTAINSWASDATKGKISDLLAPGSVDAKTTIVLANALYFKGNWAKPFDQSETKTDDFHLLNGERVSVPFMSSQKKQCVKSFDTHKLLKLPYNKGGDNRSFSMYFVLPNDPKGLPDLEKTLDAKWLTQHCNDTYREVEVGKFLVPRFKFSTGFSVPDSLRSLGLKTPFSSEADFSDIVDGPSSALPISDVVHKAFIEVNEEGTEAAAATAVLMTRSINLDPPADFVADHPFLFIIREDVTGAILFIGRITNPSLPG